MTTITHPHFGAEPVEVFAINVKLKNIGRERELQVPHADTTINTKQERGASDAERQGTREYPQTVVPMGRCG
ncbi:hypothetical protein ACIP1G_02275 [Pseudomonas sp. NPDC089392]|uniref:hypothetical protein n=1 Tax=Pseudomonas sp. NPDC089392 TaxID=3364459 RepID=UPI0038146306